ncbi:hypothetical protein [Leptospira neocaledonica]|nr:hypothetical protein [Leptospira neocaledonica]
MNSKYELTQSDFLDLFSEIKEVKEYVDFLKFRNESPGFSVKRKYASNLLFKPPINSEGSPDEVCLIRVFAFQRIEGEANKYKVVVEATKFSLYISNHPLYNYSDSLCPTVESLRRSRNTPDPIGRSIHIIADLDNKTLFYESKKISSKEIVDKIYKSHIRNVEKITEYKQKIKNCLYHVLSSPFIMANWVLKQIAKFVFGREVVIIPKSDPESSESIYIGQNEKLQKIKIFEYETSFLSIYSFSILIASGYTYIYLNCIKIEFLEDVLNNGAITLVFGLILIITYDVLILNILELNIKFIHIIGQKIRKLLL